MSRRNSLIPSLVIALLVSSAILALWFEGPVREISLRAVTVALGSLAIRLMWTNHPREMGPERDGWRLVTLAAFLWTVGVGLQTIQTAWGEVFRTFNWGDAFFLPSAICALMGLVRLPCREVREHDRLAAWLDLAIACISSGSLYWHLVLVPSLQAASFRSPARLAISLLYPVFEFLVLMALIDLLVRGPKRHAGTIAYRWGIAAFFTLLAGDVFLQANPELWETPAGRLTLHGSNLLFAAMVAMVGLSLGGLARQKEERERPQILKAIRESLVPVTWVAVPGVALAWSLVTNGPQSAEILIGATILLVPLVIYRLHLAERRLDKHLRTSILTALLPASVGSQLAVSIVVALVLALNGMDAARRVARIETSRWAEKADRAIDKRGAAAIGEIEAAGAIQSARIAILGVPGAHESTLANSLLQRIDLRVFNQPTGDLIWKTGQGMDRELLVWKRLPNSRAILVMSTPLPFLLQSARRAEGVILLLFLLASIFSTLLVTKRAKRLTAPLEDLTGAASRIQAGSLELPPLRHGPDEVGRLGYALEAMVGRLTGHLEDLRELAQRADEANHAKSRFLANMSHEIRTPLNGILGMAELLDGANLPGSERRWVQAMRTSAESLRDLLGDILDLTKIEEGRMRIEHVPFDPEALLRDLNALFQPAAFSKGLGLEVRFEHDPAIDLVSDPVRIKQILTNLLANALKFTEQGKVQLHSRLETGSWIIEVEDTGAGIAPEAQERIWETFSQADESTTRCFGGTGLGLPISRHLAQLMGGQIELARSAPNEGSLFVLRLPVETRERRSKPRAAPAIEAPANGLRVLVAEDNSVNQKVVLGFLNKLGCRGTLARDGLEAVDAARKNNWDVVLMDIHMPHMDGLEAARILRAEGYRGRILALTASALPEEREHCLQAGMDGFLAKPFSLGQLREILQDLVPSRARAERTS